MSFYSLLSNQDCFKVRYSADSRKIAGIEKKLQSMPEWVDDDAETTLSGSAFQILAVAFSLITITST